MAAQAKMTNRPVTLKHLAASLAEQHELTKRQGETLLNDLVGLITKHLKKGERIRIAGFGILQVRKRPARMGRNPATGEAIKDQSKQEGRISCGQGTEARGIAAGLRSYRRPPRSVGAAAAVFGWLIKPHGIFAVFTAAFD
jgi:DNA-binding protein HU-beta